MWVATGIYRSVYGSLCMSIEVYGCLWESMNKYEYVSVYGSFMHFYESLWEITRIGPKHP